MNWANENRTTETTHNREKERDSDREKKGKEKKDGEHGAEAAKIEKFSFSAIVAHSFLFLLLLNP